MKDYAPIDVWKLTRDGFQARAGVHRPHIAEISPMQYAHLSGRARREYDVKRSREWQASGDCAADYARQCFEAWEADPTILKSAEISSDAKTAIFHERSRREQAATDARFEELRRDNEIRSIDEVEVGDRVYWLFGRYVRVTKKFKASFRGVDDRGEEIKCAIRACHWLHYTELKAAAEQGRTTVRPERKAVDG